MQITIAERLRPFSHVPGTSTILPGSGFQVQIFPSLIRIFQLNHSKSFLLLELKLNVKGPVEQFTVFNDLEKGVVTVTGKTADGWICYHLISAHQNEKIRLLIEKGPIHGILIEEGRGRHLLHDKEWLDLFENLSPFESYQLPTCDRLSLGNHKAQDWELIKRRMDLTEILPLIHRLGQLVPVVTATPAKKREPAGCGCGASSGSFCSSSVANATNSSQTEPAEPPRSADSHFLAGVAAVVKTPSSCVGTLSLLEECQQSFLSVGPEKGEEIWRRFFMGCFKSLLVPQLEDEAYQGLVDAPSLLTADHSPLVLLSESPRLIRKLFIQQEEEKLAILPYLFPSLHCGRLLNVHLERGGRLSMEWTKKTIRRLMICVERDQECHFQFQSDVRSYRLREENETKGKRISTKDSVLFKKDHFYSIDNFQ